MYENDNLKKNISVRTQYNHRRKELKNINNQCLYDKKNNDFLPQNDLWSKMISKTSNEGQNKKVINSKTYQSNLPINDLNITNEKRHFKESKNFDYITKTQITTLPGGVKKNGHEIKDDYIYDKPKNLSKIIKSVYDYNSNINYKKHYDPITQGYNINSFPTKERYQGSYRKYIKDNDIFNTNLY